MLREAQVVSGNTNETLSLLVIQEYFLLVTSILSARKKSHGHKIHEFGHLSKNKLFRNF